MDNRPIGVFDSGVGGVSVLVELTRLLPDERFLYYGDTVNAPYGDREEAEILSLTKAVVAKLLAQNVKALVIACNTMTSAAAQALRETLSIPVVGMEPALKPAWAQNKGGRIVVLATAATLRQKKFQRLMAQYGKDAVMAPCPGLMEFAERGELSSPALDAYLKERLAPFCDGHTGGAVLGCTHYVFLKEAIAKALPGVPLFDGNAGTAKRLLSILTQANALGAGPGGVAFDSSDPRSIPLMKALFSARAENL